MLSQKDRFASQLTSVKCDYKRHHVKFTCIKWIIMWPISWSANDLLDVKNATVKNRKEKKRPRLHLWQSSTDSPPHPPPPTSQERASERASERARARARERERERERETERDRERQRETERDREKAWAYVLSGVLNRVSWWWTVNLFDAVGRKWTILFHSATCITLQWMFDRFPTAHCSLSIKFWQELCRTTFGASVHANTRVCLEKGINYVGWKG